MALTVSHYRAFGLILHSELDLPDLLPAPSGPPDVWIRAGNVPLSVHEQKTRGQWLLGVEPNRTTIRYPDVATFAVRQGCEIIVDAEPRADPGSLRLALQGTALAMLLQQRGDLTLHASAVKTGSCAAAFVGLKWDGKSTLAAWLVRQGASLLSDDIAALRPNAHGRLCVQPAFPQVKLWPESVHSLGLDPAGLPAVRSTIDKRSLRLTEVFWDGPAIPLQRVYLLAEADEIQITRLDTQAAFAGLLSGLYFSHLLAELGSVAASFAACARLANQVEVWRLARPCDLSRLDEVAQVVWTHLNTFPKEDL